MSPTQKSAEARQTGRPPLRHLLRDLLAFEVAHLPGHFIPFYGVFIVLQSSIIIYFLAPGLWAAMRGEPASGMQISGLFGLLMTVCVAVQLTLSLLHPTRRWLPLVLAAILAFLLYTLASRLVP